MSNKEEGTSTNLSCDEAVEMIARYMCFYLIVEPPQHDNMEIVRDMDRLNDMRICDMGKNLCHKQMRDYSKNKGCNNFTNDVLIKLEELQKEPIPE